MCKLWIFPGRVYCVSHYNNHFRIYVPRLRHLVLGKRLKLTESTVSAGFLYKGKLQIGDVRKGVDRNVAPILKVDLNSNKMYLLKANSRLGTLGKESDVNLNASTTSLYISHTFSIKKNLWYYRSDNFFFFIIINTFLVVLGSKIMILDF